MTQTATQPILLEQRHDQFLKTVNLPLGVAARWHDRDEIGGGDRAALRECLRGLEGAYREIIPALVENGADDKELSAWILAAQSFARTIEAAENNCPAFVVARLHRLADWHERAGQPYALADLVWNVRQARSLLDSRYRSVGHYSDNPEYHRRHSEVTGDCGDVLREIADEIAPSAVAQWDRGDIAAPVQGLVKSFGDWATWHAMQSWSDEFEIVARARSEKIDAALLRLDRLLASPSTATAEPNPTATIARMSKDEREAKISKVLDKLNKSKKKYTITTVVEEVGCARGAVSQSEAWQAKGHGRKRKAKARAVDLSDAVSETALSGDESPLDRELHAERARALEYVLKQTRSKQETEQAARKILAMTPDQQDEFYDKVTRQRRCDAETEAKRFVPRKKP